LELDASENVAIQPAHSLELNLILYFLYTSALPFGSSEFDILEGAQSDTFGYLSGYQNYAFLRKSWYLLRPINVPFKNKWLRDV